MDFLDRLVQRQRNPRSGVSPDLPSRYEPVAETFAEVEDLTSAVRPADAPSSVPPPMVLQRHLVESRVVHAGEPDRARSERPRTEASRPGPPAPVTPPEALVAAVRETAPDGEPPRVAHTRPAEDPPRREPPHTARPPAPVVPPPVEERRPTALPSPMLPAPSVIHPAQPDPGPVPADRDAPEPVSSRATTVSVSIGRIEIRPPDRARSETRPRLEAPLTPPRPAHRPRLSLEDYLARPDRGRS